MKPSYSEQVQLVAMKDVWVENNFGKIMGKFSLNYIASVIYVHAED